MYVIVNYGHNYFVKVNINKKQFKINHISPWDGYFLSLTIYDVKNSDKVTNVIEDLEERYELNENEQIVLATVKYRPEIVTQVPFDKLLRLLYYS
mgnify:CR=1 FL=1